MAVPGQAGKYFVTISSENFVDLRVWDAKNGQFTKTPRITSEIRGQQKFDNFQLTSEGSRIARIGSGPLSVKDRNGIVNSDNFTILDKTGTRVVEETRVIGIEIPQGISNLPKGLTIEPITFATEAGRGDVVVLKLGQQSIRTELRHGLYSS